MRWKNNRTEIIASNALSSFLAAIISVHESNEGICKESSTQLKTFISRDSIRARFGENFNVNIGYGLHVGWAIEGAIGTEFKIDASYLSQNVNMAEELQDLSPIYKVYNIYLDTNYNVR